MCYDRVPDQQSAAFLTVCPALDDADVGQFSDLSGRIVAVARTREAIHAVLMVEDLFGHSSHHHAHAGSTVQAPAKSRQKQGLQNACACRTSKGSPAGHCSGCSDSRF